MQILEDFLYLAWGGPFEIAPTAVVTMKRSLGLFAVLGVQALLLMLILIATSLLYTTPGSENVGIRTLLADASRSSLDMLEGAAFGEQLTRKGQSPDLGA